MQKKSKGILAAAITVLFTLSVSYFAMLSPTTAWFYQSHEDRKDFVFGEFDVALPEESIIISQTVRLRAATRFADAGEVLFDEVLHVVEARAINNGNVPARVYVTVKNEVEGTSYENPGLRYFFCGEEEGTPAPQAVKSALDSYLTGNGLVMLDYSQQAPNSTYEAQAVALLEDYQKEGYILVEPQTTQIIKVAFWVEYGEDGMEQFLQNNVLSDKSYGVSVTLTATQDTDGAFDTNTRTPAGR